MNKSMDAPILFAEERHAQILLLLQEKSKIPRFGGYAILSSVSPANNPQ